MSSIDANICIIDKEGTIIATNSSWENFAKENAECENSLLGLGNNYLEVCRNSIEAGDKSAIIALKGIQAVLDNVQEEFHYEYPCHSSKEEHWFLMTVKSLRPSDPSVVIIHTDVSHQKGTEHQLLAYTKALEKNNRDLREGKRRLDFAQSMAHLGSYVWDVEGEKVEWSDELYRIFGYEPQSFEVTMNTFLDNIHPDDSRRVKMHLKQLKEDKRELNFNCRIINPKTGVRHLKGAIKVELNDQEHLVRVSGFFQDVTESKVAEEKLIASEANAQILFDYSPILIWEEDLSEVKCYFDELKKSDVNYREYFNSHPEEVKRLASLVRITQVNRKSLEFFKLESVDELKANVDSLIRESMEVFKEQLIALAEGDLSFENKIAVVTSDGELKHLYFRLSVPPMYAETLEKVMISLIDITEIKRTKQKLQDLNADLEEKVIQRTRELSESKIKLREALDKEKKLGELKSRFVSMASHEFRTPLAAILSSVSLIKKYNERGILDHQEKHFKRIKNSVGNLTSILNDFLSLEKIESSDINLNYQEIEFNEFIEEVLMAVKPWAKDNQHINHQHHGATKLRIDPNLTQNILLNILSNALKYSPQESTVELITENKDDSLMLKVIDHGIGVPEEDQKKLFTRFFRANNASRIEGTGLGLTIVKSYLKLMKGEISFESKVDVGTTFIIKIPLEG